MKRLPLSVKNKLRREEDGSYTLIIEFNTAGEEPRSQTFKRLASEAEARAMIDKWVKNIGQTPVVSTIEEFKA